MALATTGTKSTSEFFTWRPYLSKFGRLVGDVAVDLPGTARAFCGHRMDRGRESLMEDVLLVRISNASR